MLTIEAAREAYRVGLKRYRYAVGHGLAQAGNYKRSGIDTYRDGMAAVAEATAAEAIGRKWLAVCDGPDKGDDIEGGIGVRWTPNERWGLVINDGDSDSMPMILVVGKTYPLRVVGWFRCDDGRIGRYVKHTDRATIWVVPQADLKPIADLVRMLDRERACNRIWAGGSGVVGGVEGYPSRNPRNAASRGISPVVA